MTSVLKRARVRQIQFCSRWLRRLSGVPTIFAAIKIARDVPVLREILVAMTGYRRPFPTLKDAASRSTCVRSRRQRRRAVLLLSAVPRDSAGIHLDSL